MSPGRSTLGDDNQIVAGSWWPPDYHGAPEVSLATEFQQSLGVGVGDKVSFDIGGEPFEATVASVRKVKWDSFQPNFFVVFSPGVLDAVAGTYLTSAYFHPADPHVMAQLARRFPSVSIFNVDDLLAAGAQHHRQGGTGGAERIRLHPVCRSRGAARRRSVQSRGAPFRKRHAAHPGCLRARRCGKGVMAEFVALGLLAGVSGGGVARPSRVHFVATRVLQVPYEFDPWLPRGGHRRGCPTGVPQWLAGHAQRHLTASHTDLARRVSGPLKASTRVRFP